MAALTSLTSSSLLSQAVAIQEHPTSSGGEENSTNAVPKTLVPSPSHVQGTFFTREPELSAAPLCYQTCP